VRVLHEHETLDGDAVMPGFELKLQDWFEQIGQRADRA
jgi:hypothetical protein